MKICIVPTMFPKFEGDYYGSFVFEEAKILVKQGFEVHVVTQHNPGIPYETVMDGVHVHRFRWLEPNEFKALVHFKGILDSFRLLTYVVSLFFKLIHIIIKYDLSILHAHSVIPTGFVGVLVSKILRRPMVITSHGMDVTSFQESKFFKMLIRFSFNHCEAVIAVSDDLKSKIKLLDNEDNIVVLRNGVDITRFKPIQSKVKRQTLGIGLNEIIVLSVGYLDEFKGIFDLINAFRIVNRDNVKLIMVGDGPKKDELRNMAAKFHLDESVIFTGRVSPLEIHEYYQLADIFVIPSHIDSGGPPLVVMEAMATGLPIIGTDIGGIPEGIKNSVNGFVVPINDVSELSKKLEILIDDENLREIFGNNSLKMLFRKSMTLEKKAERLVNLYQKIN